MTRGTSFALPDGFPSQQWLGGFGSMLIMFVTGLMTGWSSPYLAIFTGEDSPLPITKDEASWVAACLNLGRLVGAPFGALGTYHLGSRMTLAGIGVPLIVAWVLLVVADSVEWLYAARFVSGIGLGMALSSFPLYLGEIASPSIRGALVSLASLGAFAGSFAGNAMGAYMPMHQFAYASLVPNLMFVVVFLLVPESPGYLVRRNRIEEARRSVIKYHPKADARYEVEALSFRQKALSSMTFTDSCRELNLSGNRRAWTILIALHFFQQFSGMNSVLFYTEMLLTSAQLTAIAPSTMVIVVSGLGVPSGLAAMYLTEKYGRRMLMMVSSGAVGSAMLAMGLHFRLLDWGIDARTLQWLPTVSLVVCQIALCVGLNIMPNTILSELFAPSIKNIVACWSTFVGSLLSFVATKSYQPLTDSVGTANLFFMHAVIMAIAFIFSISIMPETKGKSLDEIQRLLIDE